ncbi:hypothetical protein MJO28_017365 [Puccinia striiformis f. sp. tritici]|uniref:Uncharacterized protein n=2 Tax=Puccinia striiformis TaxID=27350 RepID=A0A0L0W6J9_9BASI|nr:hypothetical protein Pst134EA_000627 [Puccinia striiformis f. sp. tritici]KNF06895.1 hypothetical protein PSTG_00211 [Puccinia striiformis f. sp. tritici PST-78]POW02854.1 hypothetical protein PSTT_11478 [Puccinia striiformis]KAH9473548.1 hypothetical protein Pst134EA_000627 [Puccinia striiformis f. sp. tritici]KAI7933977.1 hypothetical protein MJO28_017365 [Puccinia striiformis f. sp. tritici]KAI7967337.1 hypothetical protein MJO29_000614 [Puccinia striiformis f. sp. tritici]
MNTSKPDQIGEKLSTSFGHKRDLVIDKFDCLAHRCGQPEQRATPLPQKLSTDEINLHQAHLKRLHSSLLPLLGEQIAGLGSLIDSTALGEDSERQFEYILGIQSELHRTLVDIASVLTTICPETSSRKQSINDQHLEALKFIRLDRLRTRADRMRCTIEDFLDACWFLIEDLEISPEKLTEWDVIVRSQNRMDARKSWAIAEIESTIIFIRGSELNFAQMEWQFESPVNIDDLLSKATSRINLLNNKMNQTPTFRTLQTRNGPVIQLTKSTIAIVKLSRLFYKKLSGTAFSIKRCPLYTKMCSSELDTMISSATRTRNELDQMMCALDDFRYPAIVESAARSLLKEFQALLFLITFKLVPLIQGNEADSAQIELMTWFADWSTLLHVATRNVAEASEPFC